MKKTSIFGKWVLSLFTGLCFLAGSNLTAQNTYVKVTSESDLTAGSQYLIVCEAHNVALGATNKPQAVSINDNSISTNVATSNSDALPFAFTLETGSAGKYIFQDDFNQYISYTGSSTTISRNSTKTEWTISFQDNDAQISAPETSGNNAGRMRFILYREGSKEFRAYIDIDQNETDHIQLYKKQEADPSAPTVSLQPGSLNLSTTPNNAATETITVTGTNLTSDVTVTISGENADLFEADASTLTASEIMAEGGKELTITYTPTEAGVHSATLTLSSLRSSPTPSSRSWPMKWASTPPSSRPRRS